MALPRADAPLVGASLLANQATQWMAPATPVFAGKPAPTTVTACSTVGASLLANQATRRLAPAVPVFPGKSAASRLEAMRPLKTTQDSELRATPALPG
ncbi:hypothetical protein E3U47_23635 [Pseudomonas sp. RIT623]|nr:hypothetical protein E3U47_23635 [Pseudomonas sp. RIT623]